MQDNVLTLHFEHKVDYKVAAFFHENFVPLHNRPYEILELNFAATKFVTLPGAMYVILTCVSLVNAKTNKAHISVTNCNNAVALALANFGLLSALKSLGSLLINPEMNKLSDDRIHFWREFMKDDPLKQWNSSEKNYRYNTTNLYWPITFIPVKTSEYFERENSKFINSFIVYYNLLVGNGMILNEKANIEFMHRYFIKSINEGVKNVWDHSESWGITAIQSNKINKTTFCLFDFGIGFINSFIKRKGEFDRNNTNDKEKLKWLFQEGNTSNIGENHGHGLAIIAKFVDITQGILLIRTDKYEMVYTRARLTVRDSSFFPGTQIMINF